jgi:hypothetical protein
MEVVQVASDIAARGTDAPPADHLSTDLERRAGDRCGLRALFQSSSVAEACSGRPAGLRLLGLSCGLLGGLGFVVVTVMAFIFLLPLTYGLYVVIPPVKRVR